MKFRQSDGSIVEYQISFNPDHISDIKIDEKNDIRINCKNGEILIYNETKPMIIEENNGGET